MPESGAGSVVRVHEQESPRCMMGFRTGVHVLNQAVDISGGGGGGG